MFVCVSRVTLDIPAAGSLKAKRQVVRRVTDRVKAKFNVAVAEAEDNDLLNRAVVAMSVVGHSRAHVNEMMDKIFQYIDDMYLAPVSARELEILSFGEDLFDTPMRPGGDDLLLTIPRGERSLAEAEGLGAWEDRHSRQIPPPSPSAPAKKGAKKKEKEVNLSDARAVARSLRNRREWEKE
jgi:uncharacterized protein